ncbi:MAG: hypothetical protein DRJ30_06860 [Candidatus Methanomethylicota archaeon]|nr:MAG: hypothetical protein DRJ30_06860 [Candidatus Verstraetearchaeota archaeon]
MKLGKPDPEGYYLIIAGREAKSFIEKYKGILIEEHGGEIIIKTKSRSIGKRILKELSKLNLIVNP